MLGISAGFPCSDPAIPERAYHAVGDRLDAHAHSLGKALLALMPRAELLRIYEAERLRVHTHNTIGHRNLLLREMVGVAAKGYASDNEEFCLGVHSLGCALINPKGRAMCAIALEGSRHQLTLQRAGTLLPKLFSARDKIMELVR